MPRPRTLLACLFLGVLVNTGVAWYFSTPGVERWILSGTTTAAGTPLVFHVAEGPARQRCLCHLTSTPDAAMAAAFGGGAIPSTTFSATATPPRWCLSAESLPPLPANPDGQTYASTASGWPMLSMVQHHIPDSGRTPTLMERLRRGVPSPTRKPFYVRPRLPLIPILPGFIVNSLLYALPFVAAFHSFSLLRARWARSAGRCARCRYDIRGLTSPCPECGTPFA